MKIACINNMNNNMFSVARYLRDRGYDAHLFLHSNGYAHFMPEADSYNNDYEIFTHQLDWHEKSFLSTLGGASFRKDMEDYRFCMGCDYTPYFFQRMGRKLDMFVPHGSDIFDFPFHKPAISMLGLKKFIMSAIHKRGVKNSRYISLDITNPDMEKDYERLHYKGERLEAACPFLYMPQYNTPDAMRYKELSAGYQLFRQARAQFDFIIFHHSGQQWKNPVYKYSQKANDKLIRGFAAFLQQNKDYKACLVMLEYGPDVEESKKLCNELGIEANVRWLPKMKRKDIMLCIAEADLGTGEFGLSWFSYGVIYEVIAMAKPVMHFRDDELYRERYPDMYPMYSASSEEEIVNILNRYKDNKSEFAEVGKVAQKWFKKYAVDIPLDTYTQVIDKTFKNDR